MGVLALSALVLGGGIATNAMAAGCGKDCSGGGNTVDGVPISRYLKDREIKTEKILALIGPQLKKIRAVDAELADALEATARRIDWYYVDKPIKDLPFARTYVPIESEQTAVQFRGNVLLYRKGFNGMEKDEHRSEFIMAELLEYYSLLAEGVNTNLRQESYWKGAALLSEKTLPKDLRQRLEKIGYSIVGGKLTVLPDPKTVIAQLDHTDVAVNFPVPIGRPIPLEEARAAQQACLVGNNANIERSFFGQILKSRMPVIYPDSDSPSTVLYMSSVPVQYALRFSMGGIFRNGKDLNGIERYYNYINFTATDTKTATNSEGQQLLIHGNRCRPNGNCIEAKYLPPFVPTTILPEIKFDLVESQNIYDDDGKLNPGLHLKKVWLAVPKSVVDNGMQVEFMNQGSKVKLDYKVKVDLYLDCLKEEFARRTNLKSKTPADTAKPHTHKQAE